MEKRVIRVTGMSCGHCKKAVENAVGVLNGVAAVEADLGRKEAVVEFDAEQVTLQQICDAIEEIGFGIE